MLVSMIGTLHKWKMPISYQCQTLQVENRFVLIIFLNLILFIYDRHTVREREREREAETQAEGEAGSMHREPDVGFDPGSPGSRPGPKAGAKPLRHPGIPKMPIFNCHLV